MGCKVCCKTEDAHATLARLREKGFRKALLAPLGSAASLSTQAARQGSQQLLLMDEDGHGPHDAFSYGLLHSPKLPNAPHAPHQAFPLKERVARTGWEQ